jgi:NAD(P)-dependent dehydrogenase (short-subunit alcohol dehydrogenase family)
MTLKIEKYPDGNSTTIRLIGRMQAEHLEELKKQFRENGPAIMLDLDEVTLAYSATKGVVKIFTQGLSMEVGRCSITVNNIQPGPIDTDLNPASGDWAVPQKAATALDRYRHVDEIAAAVAFIAGPESSYMTGSNITVDGGTNA